MMPSGFTANQDGINDTFGPVFEGLKTLKWPFMTPGESNLF